MRSFFNVYFLAQLFIGIAFFSLALTSEPFQAFSNERVANAGLIFIIFGLASLLANNILAALGQQINEGGRPGWLESIGRFPWSAMVFTLHIVFFGISVWLAQSALFD